MNRTQSILGFSQKKLINKALSGVALGAMMSTVSAVYAQESDSDESFQFEEIVVTGSNIRGASVVGGAVLTIGKEELEKSGRATVADYLRELPSNLAGGVGMSDEGMSGQDTGAEGANLSGGQGVNLRGLGALSTLVLVNGRRLAASGQFGDFVDVSSIPSAAIERVEVLQDGASAIYGSDAVGGVVNFILKRQLDAPVSTARIGTATEGGGTELMLSHIHGLNWDTGHAVIGAEYYTRGNVAATDRDRYASGSDFSAVGGVNWPDYTLHIGEAANIFQGGVGSIASPVGATVPQGTNASLTNADLIPATGGIGNTYNVYDRRDLLPDVERKSIFASFDQDLAEGVTLFGDLRYSERESKYELGYSTLVTHQLTSSSPFYINDIDPSLAAANGNIAFGKVITDRPETRDSSSKHLSGQIGLKVDLFSDWQAEAIYSYAKEDQFRHTEQMKNASGSADWMACALGSTSTVCDGYDITPYNPFSTDALTDAQLEEYYGTEDLEFDSKVSQVSLKADGSLFSLPAGDVKLAVGVDYRVETMGGYLVFDTLSVAGSEGPYDETQRKAYSAFAEAFIPVTEMLDVSIAGRYEEFSGTGDYNTFDPKVGVDFRPVEGLKLTGSWGTSFHAPPMRFENDSPQPLPGGNAAFLLPASRFGPCDSDLLTFNGVVGTPGTAGEQCSFSVIINSGGAGPGVLQPESAETWTVGFDFEPVAVPGLKFSASYFNIKVDDRIQRIQSSQLNDILAEYFATGGGGPFASALNVNPSVATAQAIIDNPKFLGTFGPPVANTAADVAMIVNATQINIASLKEQGFDFAITYDFMVDDIDVGLFAYGTYLTKYALQAAPGLAFEDRLGKYDPANGSPVKLRSKQGVSLAKGPFDGRVTVNYTDSYECDLCYVPDATGAPVITSTPLKIDSWVTVDLDMSWDLSDFGGMADGTRLNFQVTNLFNSEAPFLDGGTGADDALPTAYDAANHTIIGRTVALTFTKTW
ncbi:TonB-dependent receptor plug domain-containing protein [Kordiimonas pumila]|uniref:TonB-dependent receptor plug domain-containing protein n=1 Tax=Kordiimonas pumila TaxID=2161677 RepID=A0ABV7D974_9PROT|nr:TonB-dependent receptor [Kordiimonas pumila]